ncbi:MAG: putative Holliday junction resolvase [Planctomycetota bacterium]|jgi:putative Holliday junction resolvase
MKYLGIDYGTKKVGLATSDDGGSLAFPYGIIANTPQLANELIKICDSEGIEEIVMGHSIDTSGLENKLMEDIHDLMGQLSLVIALPIHLQQETYTSMEARRPLGFGGQDHRRQASKRGKKKQQPKPIDDSAAALILQRFLEKA